MSQFRIIIFAIASTLSVAVSAAPVTATATLTAPARQERMIGEAGVWRCEGTNCTGPADTRTGLAVAACTAVASANGQVASFVAGPTSFGEAELKRCNRHVK